MKYTIKDADGNVTNTIKASAEFVEANYEHYELFVEPTVEEIKVVEQEVKTAEVAEIIAEKVPEEAKTVWKNARA